MHVKTVVARLTPLIRQRSFQQGLGLSMFAVGCSQLALALPRLPEALQAIGGGAVALLALVAAAKIFCTVQSKSSPY